MSKVTSKLQITIPKRLAEQFGIHPGDALEWQAAADSLRLVFGERLGAVSVGERLRLFDAATDRQRRRQEGPIETPDSNDRGWQREDLYERARPR